MEPRKLLRVVIKEEFVVLLGNVFEAVVLQQVLYWQERVKDYDRLLQEEKERMIAHEMEPNLEAANGWIYKKAEELAEETLLCVSAQTIRRHLKSLVEKEYLLERRNPKFKWDKTLQYRVNFPKLIQDLGEKGYTLEGYTMLDHPRLQSGDTRLQSGGSDEKNGGSSDQSGGSKLENGGAIPEITTEITSDNIPVGEQAPFSDPHVPDMQKATAIFFLGIGKKGQLSPDDVVCLNMLFKIHTPATIQSEILKAFDRLEKKGSVKVNFEGKDYVITDPAKLPVRYIWNSMQNWSSLRNTGGGKNSGKSRANPNRKDKDYAGEDSYLFAD